MFARLGPKGVLGRLGIILLILGLGRLPLPVPTLHGPGHPEFALDDEAGDCPDSEGERPTAGRSVRWHWIVLNTSALCGATTVVGTGTPDCHPDWSACEHDPSPQFLATGQSRRLNLAALASTPTGDFPAPAVGLSPLLTGPGLANLARLLAACHPLPSSTRPLLQRWNC